MTSTDGRSSPARSAAARIAARRSPIASAMPFSTATDPPKTRAVATSFSVSPSRSPRCSTTDPTKAFRDVSSVAKNSRSPNPSTFLGPVVPTTSFGSTSGGRLPITPTLPTNELGFTYTSSAGAMAKYAPDAATPSTVATTGIDSRSRRVCMYLASLAAADPPPLLATITTASASARASASMA